MILSDISKFAFLDILQRSCPEARDLVEPYENETLSAAVALAALRAVAVWFETQRRAAGPPRAFV